MGECTPDGVPPRPTSPSQPSTSPPYLYNNHLGGRISRGKGTEDRTGGGGAEGQHEDGAIAWGNKPTAAVAMWLLGRRPVCFLRINMLCYYGNACPSYTSVRWLVNLWNMKGPFCPTISLWQKADI